MANQIVVDVETDGNLYMTIPLAAVEVEGGEVQVVSNGRNILIMRPRQMEKLSISIEQLLVECYKAGLLPELKSVVEGEDAGA